MASMSATVPNRLAAYIAQSGVTQRAIARAVAASPSYINELCKGLKSPGLDLAFAIERATDGAVPASSWVSQGQPNTEAAE